MRTLGHMRMLRNIVGVVVVLAVGPAFAGSVVISDQPTTNAPTGRNYSCPAVGANCVVNATELGALLVGGDVTVTASLANDDITVATPVTWSGGARLTLNAGRNVAVTAAVSAATGGLTLRADALCAGVGDVSAAAASIAVNTLAYYHGSLTATGAVASGALTAFQLVDTTDEIAHMGATGSYALGCDVVDLGGYVPVPTFGGTFDGLGHAIGSLLVNGTGPSGLFATLAEGASVSNLVFVRPAVTSSGGSAAVLAASVNKATITDITVLDATVSGASGTGGVAGTVVASTLSRIYVSGIVAGTTNTGGVVGKIRGEGLLGLGTGAVVENVMSKVAVTGTTNVGGIAGFSGAEDLGSTIASNITTSWSAGAVVGTAATGGVVGALGIGGGASNVYWDTQTSGQTSSAGSAASAGRTTAQMRQQATYGGFDFAGTWAIRASVGRPFLVTMQRLLDVTVAVNGNTPTIITQQATFSATVTPRATFGSPSGRVRFLDGATLASSSSIGNGTLAAGVAQVNTTALAVGIHTIHAVFDGNAYQLENNASVSHTVNAGSTATALTNADGPIVATVTSLPPATGVPTGSITFNVDGTARAPVAMVGGVANLDPSTLGAGVHTVTATFVSDDGRFATSSSTSIQVTVVGPTTTTLTQSVAASQLGEPFTLSATVASNDGLPIGAVRFVADGVNIVAEVMLSGNAATASVTTLPAGPHVLIAQFLPLDANFTASVSTQLSHDIAKADSTVDVTVADIHDGVVTLDVAVAAVFEGLPAATGKVAVSIDGVAVADPELDDTGKARVVSEHLPRGNHTVTARYDGDVNYNPSDSASVDVTIELEGFRLVAAPRRSVTFPGGSVPFTLTLTPENGTFSDDVTFACSDLPAEASCTFSPAATHVDSTGSSVNLVLTTTRPIAAAGPIIPQLPPMMLLALLAAVGLTLVMAQTRRRPRFLATALLCAAFACSDSTTPPDPTEGTPPGTYTVSITARGNDVSRTTTIELEVRQ